MRKSTLFGYKAGAFTNAKKDKPGRFAMIHVPAEAARIANIAVAASAGKGKKTYNLRFLI